MENFIKIQYENYRISIINMLITQHTNLSTQSLQVQSEDVRVQKQDVLARAYAWYNRVYPLFDSTTDTYQPFDLFSDDCFIIPKEKINTIYSYIDSRLISPAPMPIDFYDLLGCTQIEKADLYTILAYFKLKHQANSQMGVFFKYICKSNKYPSNFADLSESSKSEIFTMLEIEK